MQRNHPAAMEPIPETARRLSSIQSDVLFVLYGIEQRVNISQIHATRIRALLNNNRRSDVHASNFRCSCRTLSSRELLTLVHDEKFRLLLSLTEKGRAMAATLYADRSANI